MRTRRWFLGSAAAALLAALGLRRRRRKDGVRIPGKPFRRDRLRDPHDLKG
jgi:hypothetical protein